MSMNLDAAIRLSAQVSGTNNIRQVGNSLQQLNQNANLSKAALGKWNIEINRAAREAENTTAGIRAHSAALSQLRDRVEIGSKAYNRLGREIDALDGKLRKLNATEKVVQQRGIGTSGLRDAAGAVAQGGGLQSGIGALTGSLAAAGGPVGIGAAAALAGTAGFAAAGIQNSLELETQARAVRTLTSDYGTMSVAIQEMVRQQGYQISTADATAQAYEVLSSGFTKQADVMKILSAASDGAMGGFASMSQVVDGTTSVLNSYGRTAEDARRVVDALIQAQNDGKIKVGEFADQIGRIAPTAVAAGVSLEEMLAGISALSIGGIKPEQAISGLNQAIVSIIRPTDQARELAKSLGLEFSAQALQAKGLSGFLKDVEEKTKGNTAATSILFSDVDGLRAVLRLTSDQLVTYNGHLENQRNLTGQAATAAKMAVDPLQQFNNAWKDLTITFTGGVLPVLTGAIQRLTQLISVLTSPQAKAAIGFGVELSGWLLAPGLKAQSMTLFGGGGSPGAVPVRTGGTGGRGSWGRADIRPPARAVDPAIEAAALKVLEGGAAPKRPDFPAYITANQKRPDFPAYITANQMRAWLKSQGYERTSGDFTNRGHRTPNHMLNAIDTGELDGPYAQAVQRARSLERTLRATGAFGGQLFGPIRDPRGHKDHVHIPTPGGRIRVTPALAQLMGLGGKGGMSGDIASWQNTAEEAQVKAAEELRKKKEEEAKIAAGQLDAARQLLNASEASLAVATASTPLQQAAAEYDQERNSRMDSYIEKFRNSKSEKETELRMASQALEIRRSDADLAAKIKDIEEKRTEELQKQNEALAEATDQSWEFARARQEGMDTRGGFNDGITGYLDGIGTLRSSVTDLTVNAFRGLENALVDLVTTGKAGFKELTASVLADSARMIIQQLVLANVLRMVQNLLGGGSSGIAGLSFNPIAFTPGLSFDGGGIAEGPRRGYPAMLHGTEAVVPLADGRSIPVRMQGGGGGVSVVVNVDAKGTKAEGDSSKSQAVGRELGAFVEQKILEMKRPGGLLA